MSKGIGGSTGSGRAKGIGGNVGSGQNRAKGIGGNTGNNSSSSTYTSSNTTSSDGDCFVATAAFGTPWHSEIQVLRDWRDSTLRYSTLGRAFISFYYQHGPVAAKFIKRYPIFKTPIRGIVRLIIKLIK